MSPDTLDSTFAALADPTRREILARLASGQASVKELAEPFEMTLPGVSKHLKVLERAGLISRGRVAQSRPCRLEAAPLKEAADWVGRYRRFWEQGFDRLDDYLRELQRGRARVANGGDPGAGPAGRELVVTRVLDAPRELVFEAWTQAERVKRWWGPKGFTTPFCEIDPRPGGVFSRCMRSPEGRDFWVTGVFREVVVPERLVFTDSFADGNVVPAADYGSGPDVPVERLITVTFEEQHAGSTRVTVRHDGLGPGAERDLVRGGWASGLESLAEYLAEAA